MRRIGTQRRRQSRLARGGVVELRPAKRTRFARVMRLLSYVTDSHVEACILENTWRKAVYTCQRRSLCRALFARLPLCVIQIIAAFAFAPKVISSVRRVRREGDRLFVYAVETEVPVCDPILYVR